MKLQFKKYPYQEKAIQVVIDCFRGQPKGTPLSYIRDVGKVTQQHAMDLGEIGYKNAGLDIGCAQILYNMQTVQSRQSEKGLEKSTALYMDKHSQCSINLDIEMETGTGKTYVYLKTIYELNKNYGWNKFIIIVPSVAIREGVAKSIELTAEHFKTDLGYDKKLRHFIYNSARLHEVDNFASSNDIQVMIINIQAFNSTGKDQRRIYDELDSFQSRKPIDVIKATNPILIVDEPQKMDSTNTLKSFAEFNPLMILRYSATHKTTRNLIYRLDAIDAYQEKLVKKIRVLGITSEGQEGNSDYIYIQDYIVNKNHPPMIRVEFEQQLKSGKIKRTIKKLGKRANLYDESNGLKTYADRYVITDIDVALDKVTFENGITMSVGSVRGDLSEMTLRQLQIREAIKAHFAKEQELFVQGIKCLTLFFIDEVAKYRTYDENDKHNGAYAKIFEQEYCNILNEYVGLEQTPYRQYLKQYGQNVSKVHNGYFSMDKNKRMIDPKIEVRGENKGEAKDMDAYELILKDKQRLLSFNEPVRFIFSHSALSEGWDNPNVFTICTLKNANSEIRRRQEIGRGLRLCVNQDGTRIDTDKHKINVLTVVPSESYKDFADGLQSEIKETITFRPTQATQDYFLDKVVVDTDGQQKTIDKQTARQIERYLLQNNYTDDNDYITDTYKDDVANENLAPLPDSLQPYAKSITALIENLYKADVGIDIENGHSHQDLPPNDNINRKEFLELWENINKKAVYAVDFDTKQLIAQSVENIDEKLVVTQQKYTITKAEQKDRIKYTDLDERGSLFDAPTKSTSRQVSTNLGDYIAYDLINSIVEKTQLTRRTVGKILSQINTAKFSLFRQNPQEFIKNICDIIQESKATTVIENITYNAVNECFELNDIFTTENFNIKQDNHANKHIYDYIKTDSKNEKAFTNDLEENQEVIIYSKLPNGFYIPTPVGKYNPDWAIVYADTNTQTKHIYFIAETKGSMSSMELRAIEHHKIQCAKKYFKTINKDNVTYDVIDNYNSLQTKIMQQVGHES